MDKDYVVEFTEYGAFIHTDPYLIKRIKGEANVLFNPKIPKGISPAYWYKDGSSIGVYPMERWPEIALKIKTGQKIELINKVNLPLEIVKLLAASGVGGGITWLLS